MVGMIETDMIIVSAGRGRGLYTVLRNASHATEGRSRAHFRPFVGHGGAPAGLLRAPAIALQGPSS